MGSHARVVIAGVSGDSGKTLISAGLVAAWRREGLRVAVFKKGPDYIDAAWLGWAAGSAARNLDLYLMSEAAARDSCAWHARDADISVIEGNRGVHDGVDAAGSASTARLAALLEAPIVLVVSATKMTATAAAIVRGCQTFLPAVRIGGVILNRVSSARHAQVTVAAIENACSIPVLGVVPRLDGDLLPSRHLGLVTPAERSDRGNLAERLADLITQHVDSARIRGLAQTAPALPVEPRPPDGPSDPVRIGYFHDSAFTFYYPENLEALERAGGILEPISALAASALPPLDLLYIGGGFPETHSAELSQNRELLGAVSAQAAQGLPIYAECGGLIYLGESLRVAGHDYAMSGVLPITVEVTERPQGHGYCDLTVDTPNPFFPVNKRLRGHEFHYSRVTSGLDRLVSVFSLTRGIGCGNQRDGLVAGNVLASYTHLHATGATDWARHLCRCAARRRRTGRKNDAPSEEGCQKGGEDERRRRCGRGGRRDLAPPSTLPD